MIKQMAWNTFKYTGDINTFMELMKLQNIEKNLSLGNNLNAEKNLKVNEYGDNKDQGDNFIRE